MIEVERAVLLSKEQAGFVTDPNPYPLFLGGYGSGKTTALVIWTIMQKVQFPAHNIGYYAPTYDLVRMIAWPAFEEWLDRLGIRYRLTKSPLNKIDLPGRASIIFRTMDNPGRIIGYETAASAVDELDTLKTEQAEDVWRKILGRNRAKVSGPNRIAVATTPEGFRFCYRMWGRDPQDGYSITRADTRSNKHLPAGYIDSLMANYPAHLVDAYVRGQFVNLTSGTVYRCFDRTTCATDAVAEPGEPLHVGMDFNVGQMAAVIHVVRDGKPIAVGEVSKALDTVDMCAMLRERYNGHDISVYPDSSGNSRRSSDAGETDIRTLRDAGFRVYAPAANPKVRDRINSMNAAFANGGYRVNSAACPTYVEALEQQTYDKHGEPDKTSGHDHHVDAAGYYIHYRWPLVKPAMQINMRMAM